MTTEPKPQTPRCNCGLGLLPFDDGKHYESCPCYPSRGKPQTPLTDAFCCENNSVLKVDVGQHKTIDFARSLELKLHEAERQRDEARR